MRAGAAETRAFRRVSHIVDSIAEEASGPSYSVPALCRGLVDTHWRPSLLTVGAAEENDLRGVPHRSFTQDFATAPVLRNMRHALGLKHAIDIDARNGALLHGHGLWLMANVYPGWAAQRYKAPLVISPRGMLGEAALAFSSKRKRLMWRFLQGRAARAANLFHATSDEEYADIRRVGLVQPVAVIPNGVDLPELGPVTTDVARRTLLSLGRLHPKKGLDKLLRAWSSVQDAFPEWDLVVAGPSEGGYLDALKAMAKDLDLARVSFPGPLYGDHKGDVYRKADLFVMTTLNENFGMTVAEALSHAVPVICTHGAPWSGLDKNGCGWWIGDEATTISAALFDAMALDSAALQQMGARGREWMRRDFSWPAIAQEMARVYDWLKDGGPAPASVRRD